MAQLNEQSRPNTCEFSGAVFLVAPFTANFRLFNEAELFTFTKKTKTHSRKEGKLKKN